MSETENLAQDYLDGDPSALDDEELRAIAKAFEMSEQQIKMLVKTMSKSRSQIDPTEVPPKQE